MNKNVDGNPANWAEGGKGPESILATEPEDVFALGDHNESLELYERRRRRL